jgi:D-glycero-alpha-D-manno-heptose-7-phosphate kinase
MIVTQTPLRISFFGGGTDLREFYEQEEGCVLSSAIDKYIFVIVKQRFDKKIRLGYTSTEWVDSVEELQHELVREAMRLTGVKNQIEISTLADIPAEGSGLGSSSVVTVGALNALHVYQGDAKDPMTLAREACLIEIDTLQKPIGVQDQYIAAIGGLQLIRFNPNGSVFAERVSIPEEIQRQFNHSLLLFWTNTTRKAESVLSEQRENTQKRMDTLRCMKQMVYQARQLLEEGRLDEFGCLLHEGWEQKKQLASKISNSQIDEIYNAARKAGALGGKITGAGGGGFMLLYCPHERQTKVREALSGLRELPFSLERDGTKVIFNYRR